MINETFFKSVGLGEIYEKVIAGERLTPEDGIALYNNPSHSAVGALAQHVRARMHGNEVSYVPNRQINYTNVCVNKCVFCAFRRDREDEAGAFILSQEEILSRIREANAEGIAELHMVGGCHPDLRLPWFESLLERIHEEFPLLPIKAFTPVEIRHFAQMEGIAEEEVLKRLKNAGLCMMPGGGAEIFDAKLREFLCPAKANAEEWLRISGAAHKLGIRTNCTMLFGHIETREQRIDHLVRLREQQDRSGGFTCFIPLPFLKHNSRLKLPPDRMRPVDGLEYLRTIAISRLMLDNIFHIKAYWVMLGLKLAQIALWYGADDLDGTIVEEHIGHMAGAQSAQSLTVGELETVIRDCGFIPRKRNAVFETVEVMA